MVACTQHCAKKARSDIQGTLPPSGSESSETPGGGPIQPFKQRLNLLLPTKNVSAPFQQQMQRTRSPSPQDLPVAYRYNWCGCSQLHSATLLWPQRVRAAGWPVMRPRMFVLLLRKNANQRLHSRKVTALPSRREQPDARRAA